MSITPASVTENNENFDPLIPIVLPPITARSFSDQTNPNLRLPQNRKSLSCGGQSPGGPAPLDSRCVHLSAHQARQPQEHLQHQTRRPNGLQKRIRPIFATQQGPEFPSLKRTLGARTRLQATFPIFTGSESPSFPPLETTSNSTSPSEADEPAVCSQEPADSGSIHLIHKLHKKRRSTASSGFVHTVKTASLSNASLSLIPRSLRLGRSTDSSGIFGHCDRPSMDSDRPPTTSSVDDAVFSRGIKRRQIIQELIRTEESYIADLKALIYLYSTLLATATSIPNRVRSSIQKNVHDLLDMHEILLRKLHEEAFQAAARKWADTSSPRHLGSPRRHGRWRSVESSTVKKLNRDHRQTRSSIDCVDRAHGRPYLGSADPQDAANVALILKNFHTDFLIYEEYSANHSLIAHEFQKHAPRLWSTYESGIESLAKSLTALDHRSYDGRKGLTVGDLLIKPIQRLTKYPLILTDILKQTPVSDCPSAHADIEVSLQCLRNIVKIVNLAVNNRDSRIEMQRRWSLQSRLNCRQSPLDPDLVRTLGPIQLCGVLHVVWQTKAGVNGAYCLCVLFDSRLMIAIPAGCTARFDITALLRLSDIKIESASDGRGLQCHATLHTWKLCFEINGSLHEFIMSACSATEEAVWRDGLQGKFCSAKVSQADSTEVLSMVVWDLKSVGLVYGHQNGALGRKPSVQRAATVGNRAPIVQLIVRNTHNAQDLGEYRQASTSSINRSQSHMTSNRIVVLSPKRSERARLESSLADVWTRERLPYPGMIGSRGGQIIRASAGSLVRKLSLASIHAPFSRRSGSLSIASRKSYDTFAENYRTKNKASTPVFEVRKESLEEPSPAGSKAHDIPEVDTMENLVSRMIGSGNKRQPVAAGEARSLTKIDTKQGGADTRRVEDIGPEDPADVFYADDRQSLEGDEVVQASLGGKRKRWSNPIGKLRGLSAEGLRHMLYSSK
ncbi:hypothetical protein B0A52_08728 [Exophiala mesophila]|uniref:DH domain-containing protein n=1 Tax=Exophiala mesophila TaxID=212818 RepID=A0A438MZ06_EXOME|nr:hypothetical protein B0A52_08728 [Exophiala mesophila]